MWLWEAACTNTVVYLCCHVSSQLEVWPVSFVQVGAPCLEDGVIKFDDVYRKGSEGKEGGSLFTILALLYDFHLVQSLRIFNILRKCT